MRGYCLLSALAILVAFTPAYAKRTPAPTPVITPGPVVTEMQGTIPDSLAGTWLAICNFKRNDGRYLNRWHVYRFSHTDTTWHMQELHGAAPPELDKPITATQTSGKLYTLDDTAFKAVKAALPKFTAHPEGAAWSRVIWRSVEHFPKEFPQLAEGAKFSIEFIDVPTDGTLTGGGAFYVKNVTPTTISGDGAASAVAKAGFVAVPLDIAGPFTMYRLQGAAACVLPRQRPGRLSRGWRRCSSCPAPPAWCTRSSGRAS